MRSVIFAISRIVDSRPFETWDLLHDLIIAIPTGAIQLSLDVEMRRGVHRQITQKALSECDVERIEDQQR